MTNCARAVALYKKWCRAVSPQGPPPALRGSLSRHRRPLPGLLNVLAITCTVTCASFIRVFQAPVTKAVKRSTSGSQLNTMSCDKVVACSTTLSNSCRPGSSELPRWHCTLSSSVDMAPILERTPLLSIRNHASLSTSAVQRQARKSTWKVPSSCRSAWSLLAASDRL